VPIESAAAFDLQLGVKIALRDGVNLSASVYLPRRLRAPTPCVVTLTPYNRDPFHEQAVFFAKKGLPFVVVDVRGRGNSEGTFLPYKQEAADGHDVVEWLAAQSYCNGKVAMWGASYLGYAQWATAKQFPPHLATIIPVAAPYIGVDFPMRNNIFYPFVVQWITFVSGRTCQSRLLSDTAHWAEICRHWHESGRPFRELDTVFGDQSAVFQEWLAHPQLDEYWDAYNPTADQYARLDIPILTVTGSYDDDQPGALEHYKRHMQQASPSARSRHYLIIGPWDHLRTGMPSRTFGGLTLGAASVIDMGNLQAEWFAWTLQNGPKPEFLRKAVAYYLMGAEQWRYADTLDEVTREYHEMFIDSKCNATDIFHSGVLADTPGTGGSDTYTYDPRDASGPEVAAEVSADAGSVVDQRGVIALRGKAFVYHSAPLAKETDICGFFKLFAWISIDCPDTDFYVSIYEITFDGSSIRLSSDAMRARYRRSFRSPVLISIREPLLYTFDRFTFVARRVPRGHRLRLVVAPVGRLVDSIFTEKNYNAGGIVAEESCEEGRPVTVRLFHDDVRRSMLSVPMGHPDHGSVNCVVGQKDGCNDVG